MSKNYTPIPLFDNVDALKSDQVPEHIPAEFHKDYHHAKQFLLSYQHNADTFKSYRREAERFAQYCWFIQKKSLLAMKRAELEEYLVFCQNPPLPWIGTKNVTRFLEKDGLKMANPVWRPFVAGVSKAEHKAGKAPNREEYRLSEKGFREIFTVLNCFYNFMIQEEISEGNPVVHIKQKNRFYRSYQSKSKIRRVSELQWKVVIETAEKMAQENPDTHERTLFIMSILYGMYLRISELTSNPRWSPSMNDFAKDHEGHWWFTTVGKGNKERMIAVSPAILDSLKRWRKHLGLSPALPLPSDNTPLIPKKVGYGALTDTSHIRRIVQKCFDEAIFHLKAKGLENDAEELAQATVHWLRHTGISDDVKFRPREHVRDDAGHSSSSITDKYIDINLRERHKSAQEKIIKNNDKSLELAE